MVNKNTASVILSKLFIENVRRLKKDDRGNYTVNSGYKQALLDDAYAVLATTDYYEVKEKILNYKEDKTSFYNLSNFLGIKVNSTRPEEELITLGRFYLHPQLQMTPSLPTTRLDPETNEFVTIQKEKFYLEIKESYTLDDLLTYFYMKHQEDPLPGTSHKTQMKNLVADYPLDTVLYLIDASAMLIHDDDALKRPSRNPAFLNDHLEEARFFIIRRKNVLTEGGLTSIVPKNIY